jgi:hypothetical protein
MADGRDHGPGHRPRWFLWTEIFRSFQVAIDPRKLLVAAAGILAMSFGWWLLSVIFYEKAPDANAPEYQASALTREFENKKKPGTEPPQNYTEEDLKLIARKRYEEDRARWEVLDELAGPGGRLRTLPWFEYRGPNPFLFLTAVIGGSAVERSDALQGFLTGSVPVLVEPLVKLLLPVAKIISPGVSPLTRFYLLLIILWNLAVWAFCGGVITRLAAVQLAGKGPISFKQAIRYVAARYVNYLSAPLIPLGIITAVVIGLIFVGLLGMIPVFGDLVIFGVGLPAIVVAGAIMAVFLVGLVGYPLMYTTLSVEGDSSDTFDALSRSINYVYQAPWQYLWYSFVAVVYGAAVTFFVIFFASLMVYLGKWAVSQAPWNEAANRKPDYLFVYAPESFGWRELLLRDSPYAIRQTTEQRVSEVKDPHTGQPIVYRKLVTYESVNPQAEQQNRSEFWSYNKLGAGLVAFWLGLIFLMMLGFSYSFFWSAATVIYLLMRKKVDEAELDEVAVEDEEPEAPLAPPKMTDAPPGPSTSLPVITPPTAPPPPPALLTGPLVPPPPPPATIPFTGPVTPEPGSADGPRPSDAPKRDEDKPPPM